MTHRIGGPSALGKRRRQVESQYQCILATSVRLRIIAGTPTRLEEAGSGIEGAGGGVVLGHLEKQPGGAETLCLRTTFADQPGAEAPTARRRADGEGQDFSLVGNDPQQDEAVSLLDRQDTGLTEQGLKGRSIPGAGKGGSVDGRKTFGCRVAAHGARAGVRA